MEAVYEPTGSYSALLNRFCHDKAINAFVINPKQSRNYAKAIGKRNKTDRVDAEVLSRAIVVAEEDEIRIPVINAVVEEIKELMSYYKFTVKQRVKTSNHLEAISSKNGSAHVIRELQKSIRALERQEKEILAKVLEVIAEDEKLQSAHENIKSIKGIGDVSAAVLLHLFLKYPDANRQQIVSLTGLDPVERESGSSVKSRSKISKAGSKLYRGTLFMSVMAAVRHNDEMRTFFTRLKENGKHTTLAQIAVMRKLIVIAHSLYKNDEKYSSEKYKKMTGSEE